MKKLLLSIMALPLLPSCVPAEIESPPPAVVPKTSSQSNCNSYIIPYMPYSDTSAQILYLSRSQSNWTGEGDDLSVDITADAIDSAGNVWALGVIGVAHAGQITKLAQPIKQALLTSGFSGTGKTAIRLQLASPENAYVYSSYNAGSVRGQVEVECVK